MYEDSDSAGWSRTTGKADGSQTADLAGQFDPQDLVEPG